MAKVKILALVGSTREGSFNKKLLAVSAAGAHEAGAEVTVVDLREFPLPFYDGDLEEKGGLPENAKKLKQLFLQNHGLLIASPEYNSSISGVLKNALDWVSRAESDSEPALSAFQGKTAAIIAASPGGLGGIRGLVHLRSILGNIQVTVLPEQLTISGAGDAFNPDGSLKSSRHTESAKRIGARLVEVTSKLQ